MRCIFVMLTAEHLHRAWNMTPLTGNVMRMLCECWGLRMSWDLGVLKLKFRLEDGLYEVHRKVPYDYDSEFQDKFTRIANAAYKGDIDIQRALQYQVDVEKGLHTAPSGLFLRNNPGRLILYPLVAATCTVIFFGGDWKDFAVATVCGIVAGLIEYRAGMLGQNGRIALDVIVGISTGLIAGIVYEHMGGQICISSILLGNLYWFFYGTAFVIGLLEIINGELEVGVTRFIAVSVKTFILCLGSAFGLMMAMDDAATKWFASANNCGRLDLDEQWWRIPLYLASCVAVNGQYRFPHRAYWRPLVVQLVAYVVQYELQKYQIKDHAENSNMEFATSNTAAAVCAVIAAAIMQNPFGMFQVSFDAKILRKNRVKEGHWWDNAKHRIAALPHHAWARNLGHRFGFLRDDSAMDHLMPKLQAMANPKKDVWSMKVTEEEERLLERTIVEEGPWNIWALLMPAVYQLVPGSVIAKFWFNMLFPPPVDSADYAQQSNVFAGLMVVATSLAIGLMLGIAFCRVVVKYTVLIGKQLGYIKDLPESMKSTSSFFYSNQM